MDQVTSTSIARTLRAMVLLQILTIGVVVYLLIPKRGAASAGAAEDARYQQSVAEFKKTIEEYREVTARYQAALDEWKKLPDYKQPLPPAGADKTENSFRSEVRPNGSADDGK